MKDFRDRLATVEDIPAIKELMQLSITQLLGPLLTPEQLEASFDSMGLDDQLIKDGTYFMILMVRVLLVVVVGVIERRYLEVTIHPIEMIIF